MQLTQKSRAVAHQYTDSRYCSQIEPCWYTLGRPYAAQEGHAYLGPAAATQAGLMLEAPRVAGAC